MEANAPLSFECSAPHCHAATVGHYCNDHVRFCAGCGDEFSASELNIDGQCIDCEKAADDEDDEVVGCPCGDEGCVK